MPRICACLATLFTELPVEDRFEAARDAGFAAVEIPYPYDLSAAKIGALLAKARLELVLISAPPPNYAGGPRGYAAVPGQELRFRHDFRRALRYANELGAAQLHLMAGVAEGPAARASYVANLRWAAAQAPGQSLLIEPISRDQTPGYFLDDFDLACAVLDEVGAANLGLLFDAFHAQRITGDLIGTWDKVAPRVAHLQVGGVPDRHEPGPGEIDWRRFFSRVEAAGYGGWIGAEYQPAGRTVDGLGWIRRMAQG